MEYDKSTIYNFLEQFEDFTPEDRESGYKNVYRPGWHMHPFQFWFNPPFDNSGKSIPTLSGTISLLDNGNIMIEDARNKLIYNLDDCLGDTIESFILSIENLEQ